MLRIILLGMLILVLVGCVGKLGSFVTNTEQNVPIAVNAQSNIALNLPAVPKEQQTIYLQTRGKMRGYVSSSLRSKLRRKGYKFTKQSSEAHYLLQVKVVYADQLLLELARENLHAGYSKAIITEPKIMPKVADKVNVLLADLQITERVKGVVGTEDKYYRTRVLGYTVDTDVSFNATRWSLAASLAKEICNLF